MTDPVKVIGSSARRIAAIAAIRAALQGLLPTIIVLAAGLMLGEIGMLTWARLDRELAPHATGVMRAVLTACGVAGVTITAFAAWLAWRKAQDFIVVAERVDGLVGGKEEVLTLATLAHPSPKGRAPERSPLFPILWRRASTLLERFDPSRAFKLDLGSALARPTLASLAIVAVIALAVLPMLRVPSPYAVEAHKLRVAADDIGGYGASPESKLLAERLRAAADALEDRQLAAGQKLERLAAVAHELEALKPPPEAQKGKSAGSAASAAGKGNSSGSGEGKGAGDSAKGQGTGKGEGKGAENGRDAGGKESGQGGANSERGKHDNDQLAELRKDLQNAQAKVETEGAEPDKSRAKAGDNRGQGKAPAPGRDKSKRGSDSSKDNQDLSGSKKLDSAGNQPKGSERANGEQPKGKDTGSTSGDTHLGEFPAPARYERFYKPGENGPPLEIKDARYVVFRIPPAAPTGGGGKTVLDTERPVASTPYSNAPLNDERIKATPDERQLVPPRYRDLIR